MNVAMGINSEYQVYYGGTAITGSAVAEGERIARMTPH